MTARKVIEQYFSGFRGVDFRSSDLSRPPSFAKRAENFEIEKNFTLGGVKGLKTYADPVAGSTRVIIHAGHNYISKDPVTGAITEELILMGEHLYRLLQTELAVTYSGSGTWGYSHLPEADGEFHFKLYVNGSEVLDEALGSGLEKDSVGFTTLLALDNAIDAVTNFSATGGSTSRSASVLPLVDEQGLSPGTVNIPYFILEQIPSFNPEANYGVFAPYYRYHDDIALPPPVFLTKNNVCYIATGGALPLMKYDGVKVTGAGVDGMIEEQMGVIAASNSPALVGSFRYYVRKVRRDAKGNEVYGRGFLSDIVTTTSGQAPRISVALNGKISNGIKIGQDVTTSATTNTITLSAVDESILLASGYPNLAPGDMVWIDGGGVSNLWRRITSINRATKTIVVDGASLALNASGGDPCEVYFSLLHLAYAFAQTNTLQSNVSTITTSIDANFHVGDWVYFPNEAEWFRCTAIGSGTFTIDGVVSIPSGTYTMGTQLFEVFRTEDQGTEKFYLSQRTFSSQFFDTTTDANLGEEVIIPTYELDELKERPSLITEHQGIMIASGGKVRANRLHIESVQYPEAFPLDVGFYDVRAQDSGVITAIWSDTTDQLAVFKDFAYYSVIGDFSEPAPVLTTKTVTEGDIGISSQTSLVKVRGLNIGIGPLGPVVFQRGVVDYELTKQLDSQFLIATVGDDLPIGQRLRVGRAHAVNDRLHQQALFFVPAFTTVDGVNHKGANEYSKIFTLDYSESAWLTMNLPSLSEDTDLVQNAFWPTAGMVIYENRLHLLSVPYDGSIGNGDYSDFQSYILRRPERAVLSSSYNITVGGETLSEPGNYRFDYAFQHKAIPYDFLTQWYFSDSPLTDKLFQYLAIYSFRNVDFTPFTLRVRSYLDWDETTAIDDVNLEFNSSTPWKVYKLLATRGKAIAIRFTVEGLHEKPSIAGYELIPGEVDQFTEGVR